MADRFSRLIVMNTVLPVGESIGEGFDMSKSYASQFNDISVSGLLATNYPGAVDMIAISTYATLFPDGTYKADVRQFRELVAISPEIEGTGFGVRAKEFWSTEWTVNLLWLSKRLILFSANQLWTFFND